jgi:hypothetical protein
VILAFGTPSWREWRPRDRREASAAVATLLPAIELKRETLARMLSWLEETMGIDAVSPSALPFLRGRRRWVKAWIQTAVDEIAEWRLLVVVAQLHLGAPVTDGFAARVLGIDQ